jgi:hypothetical protein
LTGGMRCYQVRHSRQGHQVGRAEKCFCVLRQGVDWQSVWCHLSKMGM